MDHGKAPDACAAGVAFIDAQVLMLNTHAGLLAKWIEEGGNAPDLGAAERLLEFRHARPEEHAHSEDGTPTKGDSTDNAPVWPSFNEPSQRVAFALHVPCMNAIIAVGDFFDVHRLSASRTPEVQFLMHLRDAALNANIFSITAGEHRPHAAFGGLVIDEKLDGNAMFGDDARKGFIAFGDVVGLLRYLRKLLRSMQTAISAGDAG
ncbi:hypothetical protein [Caballeronia sp. BR00000012568055]|uniref:hypothetical protein n=1 Tax=Caballeronia sp. BR00000012568055 TaxID=2918761 RepID=UPI0023FA3D8A|nr:hypothetical protein [Caballeronia sp. BR00000012568055]